MFTNDYSTFAPRPCEVDGCPATFLRWYEGARVVLHTDMLASHESLGRVKRRFDITYEVPSGFRVTAIPELFALVEWPDGCVGKVDPESIRFTDTKKE